MPPPQVQDTLVSHEVVKSLDTKDTKDTKDSTRSFNHQGQQVILPPSSLLFLNRQKRQGRQEKQLLTVDKSDSSRKAGGDAVDAGMHLYLDSHAPMDTSTLGWSHM